MNNHDHDPQEASLAEQIAKGILQGVVFGSYKSATYIYAAGFLKKAIIAGITMAETNEKGGA